MANPTLATALIATLTEDTSVALSIEAAPAATDGSEYLTLEISDIPTGWMASGLGTFNAATGTWSITLGAGMAFSGGPTLTPPANSDADIPALIVTARSFSAANGAQTGTRVRLIEVTTDAAADTPSLTAASVTGYEDTSVAVDITAALADTDGSESFTSLLIMDVPAGFTVNGATALGGGTWKVSGTSFSGVSVSAPANYYGTINLATQAIAEETTLSGDEGTVNNNSATSATKSFSVTFLDVNDPANVSLADAAALLAEGASTATSTKVADIVITDDTLGTNTLSLSGADAGLFEISGHELRLKAGAALDFETNPVLDVVVSVDDAAVGSMPDSMVAYALSLIDMNEAPTVTLSNKVMSLFEYATETVKIKIADITVADDALGFRALSLTGADAALFEISGTALYLKNGFIEQKLNPVLDVSVSVADPSLPGTSHAQSLAIAVNARDTYFAKIGTTANNALSGTIGSDKLEGRDGNDTLNGLAGNDLLLGGNGIDKLYGSAGTDKMTGGAGQDTFYFLSVTDSGRTASTRDVITDFARSQDKIHLGGIDANSLLASNQAFSFIGTEAFHRTAGELRFAKFDYAGTVSDRTVIEGDVNGDGKADFQIALTGLKSLAVTDFYL